MVGAVEPKPRIEPVTEAQFEQLLPLIAAYQRACLYWHFTSLVPAETVLMNDLFVTETARGHGIGRALIEVSADIARNRGAHHLEWATAPDNATAQHLYDATGAPPAPGLSTS